MKAAEKESTFKTHVRSLIERGVLDVDDMTVVVLGGTSVASSVEANDFVQGTNFWYSAMRQFGTGIRLLVYQTQ